MGCTKTSWRVSILEGRGIHVNAHRKYQRISFMRAHPRTVLKEDWIPHASLFFWSIAEVHACCTQTKQHPVREDTCVILDNTSQCLYHAPPKGIQPPVSLYNSLRICRERSLQVGCVCVTSGWSKHRSCYSQSMEQRASKNPCPLLRRCMVWLVCRNDADVRTLAKGQVIKEHCIRRQTVASNRQWAPLPREYPGLHCSCTSANWVASCVLKKKPCFWKIKISVLSQVLRMWNRATGL